MNRLEMTARLTRDPELQYTQSGTAYCRFGIAVRRRFKNQNGEYEADFFNCVAWGGSAEFISENFAKGKEIGICGRLQSRSWDTDEGEKRTAVEIVVEEVEFIGPKSGGSSNEYKGVKGEEIVFDDNDLPF